jgi:hypothetical protein
VVGREGKKAEEELRIAAPERNRSFLLLCSFCRPFTSSRRCCMEISSEHRSLAAPKLWENFMDALFYGDDYDYDYDDDDDDDDDDETTMLTSPRVSLASLHEFLCIFHM